MTNAPTIAQQIIYAFEHQTKTTWTRLQPPEETRKGMISTTTTTRPRNLVHLNRDRGYRFKERDPVLEEITKMITDSELEIGEIIEKVLDISDNQVHLSYSTIANWQSGKTRRPQNFTVVWVAAALGYKRVWQKAEDASP